jgi:adenylate cyclase
MKAYLEQDWSTAKILFIELAAEDIERLIYKIYLERIALFEVNPPPEDWDGVFEHKNK